MYVRSRSRRSSRACDARCSRLGERRVVARPYHRVSGSRRFGERAELSFRHGDFLVHGAEIRAQIAHLRQHLVLVALERHDVVPEPESFEVTPLRLDGRLEPAHFVVGLRQRFARRAAIRARETLAVDVDRRVDERRKRLGIPSGADQLDDVGLRYRQRREMGLHPGDRIGPELRWILADAREPRRDFLQHRPACQNLHFSEERARGLRFGACCGRRAGCGRRRGCDLDARGGAILGRPQPHIRETHGERDDQCRQEDDEAAAIGRMRARGVGVVSEPSPAFVDRSLAKA